MPIRRVCSLIRIVVRSMGACRDHVIMANQFDTIDNFKAKIQDKFGIPVLSQWLVLRTTVLSGDGCLAARFKQVQSEIILHVRDLRTMQIYIATPSGRHQLIEVVPSLPVAVLKHRVRSMDYVVDAHMRLTFGGRELEDRRTLADYGIEAESTVHATPRMAGGSMPEQEQEDSEDEEENELTDDDRTSQGSSLSGDNDRTASMDSLPTDDDGGPFDHRLLRTNQLFQNYIAGENPHDYESDSQATTIRYIADDLALIDSHPDSCRAGSINARSDGIHGMLEGEPDPDVSIDFQPAACRARSIDTGGEGEPEGKRARHGDGCYQIWVKTLTGKTVILWVEAADTIATVKLALAVFMGWEAVRPIDLRIIFSGSQLEDHMTLGDHKVLEGSTLHAALRVRGGAKRARDYDPDGGEEDFVYHQELADIFDNEGPPQEEAAAVAFSEPPAAIQVAVIPFVHFF
jgi:hypothetical protein